jgi:hypothetical protein
MLCRRRTCLRLRKPSTKVRNILYASYARRVFGFFLTASSCFGPDVSHFEMGKVTDAAGMFMSTLVFNQDISMYVCAAIDHKVRYSLIASSRLHFRIFCTSKGGTCRAFETLGTCSATPLFSIRTFVNGGTSSATRPP